MPLHDRRTICFIFARGGSKGLPGKNIKMLAGKPLIGHAITIARSMRFIETVIVSTDDPCIAKVAREFGAEVPFIRPAELASDSASEWLAWRHAIEWFEKMRGSFDIFISLPPTSPFRIDKDVLSCVEALDIDCTADAVITVREAERNPFFNMVAFGDDGYVHPVISLNKDISRRQDAPAVYDVTTVAYAARPEFIKRSSSLFDGAVRTVLVPAERALDIDTPYDFELAEAIVALRLKRNKSAND